MAEIDANSGPQCSLPPRRKERCDWSLADRLIFVQRLARQVQTLHQNGRIHRAICIDTLSIAEDGQPMLPAIGGTRPFGGDHSDPEYCPPELSGDSAILLTDNREAAANALRQAGFGLDPRRIDTYQLGVLLYRLVANKPIVSYIYDATLKGQLAPSVRSLLEQTLGFDSPMRFQTCDRLLAALEDALHETQMLPKSSATRDTPPTGSVVLRENDTPSIGTRHSLDASSDCDLHVDHLGHFRILEQIGRGGMGDVYRAYDESLARTVAIKVLPPQLARDADFIRRFHAEATAAASIAHPNVVPIYFIGEDQGRHFFAMQYVEGESLAERLRREGRLQVDDAMHVVSQCASGLQAAHARGLIHRDVKPGNILLERETGRAMLVDFGLVRRVDGDVQMTATGVVMGTVDYIAPEQARGRKIDARADIYSLGVLLYQLLAGQLPFTADSPTSMVFQHAYEMPFPLEKASPDVPAPVVQMISRMMAKNPKDRYPNCGAVLADINAFHCGEPLATPEPFPEEPSSTDLAACVLEDCELTAEQADNDAEDIDVSQLEHESVKLPRLPQPRPLQGIRDWAATIFRRHAPEFVQEMQNTVQQMDGAVAQYERRRNRLARLLEEAQPLGSELPPEQVEDLERQFSTVETTLARLRSQQAILKARLITAEAQRQLDFEPLPQKRRYRYERMAMGVAVLLAVSVSVLLLTSALSNSSPAPVNPQPLTALTEAQRQFRDLAEQRYADTFNPPRWRSLTSQEKSAMEDELLGQLSSSNVETRIFAINALGDLRSMRAVPELLPIAAERIQKDDRDRWMATRALGLIGDKSVVPELAHLTYHYDQKTQLWAQIAMVQLTGVNFLRDIDGWRGWWREQGGTPPISNETVPWATLGYTPRPVPTTTTASQPPKVLIIGNSPYYQAMTQMASNAGLNVGASFNADYEKYLPLAKGNILLIETHRGTPIVSAEALERHFPTAMSGLADPSTPYRIDDTTIAFLEFSKQLDAVKKAWLNASAATDAKVHIAGNSPFYQAMGRMAADAGLHQGPSFNYRYEQYLPESRGHILLIETHQGKPIVPLETLEALLPGASAGLQQPDRLLRLADNTIVAFVDFPDLRQLLGLQAAAAANQPTPALAPSQSNSILVNCEDNASAEVTFQLKDSAHASVLRSWQVQAPGKLTLDVADLDSDSYNLFVSADGYARQIVNIRISHGVARTSQNLMLYRKRYVVLRYASNHDGSHDLSSGKTEQGRVAVSHFGQVPDLRGDWQIWQKGRSLFFELHRYSTNFGFAKPSVGATFDSMTLAPENNQYEAKSLLATPGLLLFTRIAGNQPSEKCYAKIEVETVAEKPPADVQVIENAE